MNREPITEEESILFKKYLTKDDYKAIAKDTGKPESTVQSIVKRQRKISDRNKNILEYLYTSVYLKMREEARFIKNNIEEIKNKTL